MDIYEKIQRLCEKNKISIRKLERDLGFGNSTISKWKKSAPSIDKIRVVADYFKMPIDYFMEQPSTQSEHKANNKPNLNLGASNLFSGIGGLDKGLQKNYNHVVHIEIMGEPEIHIHSKFAYDLVKKMRDMPDEDLEFLLKTAEKISPNPKKNKKTIYVKNPYNNQKDDIPFSQYPTVTNKDIDEFAARNAKKNFSREEIAEIIYEMRKDD